jgi:hypothetical protein
MKERDLIDINKYSMKNTMVALFISLPYIVWLISVLSMDNLTVINNIIFLMPYPIVMGVLFFYWKRKRFEKSKEFIYIGKEIYVSEGNKPEVLSEYLFENGYIRTFHKGSLHNLESHSVIKPSIYDDSSFYIKGKKIEENNFSIAKEAYINSIEVNKKLGNF